MVDAALTDSTGHPKRRVILLGASNLIRGISPVIDTARHVWGCPLDVLAAAGHGRSYGLGETRVLARSLPGILACGLWRDLDDRPQLPTASLLTDIGNDLLYGTSVDQVVDWVQNCLRRLVGISQRVVMTELPVNSIKRTDRHTFLFMRSILFPRSRLRYEDAMQRVGLLNEEILKLASHNSVHVIAPENHWYGLDPIHIKTRFGSSAWKKIISAWQQEIPDSVYARSVLRWLLLRTRWPQRRRLFGFVQRQKQPSCRLNDGTLVSFY